MSDGPRSGVSWTIKGGAVLGPAPFLVMGILNVTPDSFSDGGLYAQTGSAVGHGLDLLAQGADIVDIGGQSTRPFSQPVSVDEELARVMPVLEGIIQAKPDTVISLDTDKSQVASQGLAKGAVIVNDVSACSVDPGLLDVLAQFKPGYVLMHSQGNPQTMQIKPSYSDVVEDIQAFFEAHMKRLVLAGLPEDRVALDPGIGFGKTPEHNLAILRNLERFLALGRPLLIGLSRKSFLGDLLGLKTKDRELTTQVASALAWMRGAAIHRVHQAGDTVRTLKLAQALC